MDENREFLKSSLSSSSIKIKPNKFLNELKNKFTSSTTNKSLSSDISLINNETKSKKSLNNYRNDNIKIKTSNLIRSQPVSTSSSGNNTTNRFKLNKTPSKEFLNLKNSIERQLQMPRLVISNQQPQQLPIKLDSLGSSAINTDQSANMSLTSFSSSSLNNNDSLTTKCVKTSQITKIPTRINSTLNETILKPKLIDLEFKNELERLFSGISTNEEKRSRSETKIPKTNLNHSTSIDSKKRVSSVFNMKSRDNSYSSKYEKSKQTKCSTKLKDLFSVISGNLIVDYSDLLVEFKDDLIEDSNSNSCELESVSDEMTNESVSKQFSLLNSCDLTDVDLKGINNEKLIQFLINIMVKSCRMYDVATMKTDAKISYWRYANPIVAAFKSKSTKSKIKKTNKKINKIDSFTQTNQMNSNDLEESTHNTSLGTDLQNTIIETKLFAAKTTSNNNNNSLKEENLLTQSIIELISESLSASKPKEITKLLPPPPPLPSLPPISLNKLIKNDNSSINVNNQKEKFKTKTYNKKKSIKINKNEIEDLDIKIKKEEEILKQNRLDFNQLCQTTPLETITTTTQTTIDNADKNNNEYSNNEDDYYYEDEDDDDDDDEDNRMFRETITNSSKSINKKRLINYGIRNNTKLNHSIHHHNHNLIDARNGHHYYQRRRSMRSNKLVINNTSKAQDETLRDAENISDIDDNELDIDQWDCCSSEFLNTTNNSNNNNTTTINKMKLIAPGTDLNSNKNILTIHEDKINNSNNNNINDSKPNLTRTSIQIREEIVEEEEANLEEENHLIIIDNNNKTKAKNLDKQISSTSLSFSSTPLSLSLSSSSNNNSTCSNNKNTNIKYDALCMFNSTLNVCHLFRTTTSTNNDNLEPLAKLKSSKHRSVQVNLEDEEHIDNHSTKSTISHNNTNQIENLEIIEEKQEILQENEPKVMEITRLKNPHSTTTISTISAKSTKIGIAKKLERTHSLDSLENDEYESHQQISTVSSNNSNKHFIIDAKNHSDFNVDLDINISRIDTIIQHENNPNNNNNNNNQQMEKTKQELSEIPEIKIDFEYQIKKSLSPNLSEDMVKKRARESLKFWKDEEEKRKQHESSSSLNNSYSIMSTATSSSVSQTKTEPKSPSITIKRVKERINVFETIKDSKNQTQCGKQTPIQLVPPSNDDDNATVPKIQSIQSRIKTFEESFSNNNNNNNKKSTSPTITNNEITFKDYHHSPRNSSKKLTSSKSLDCELDSQTSCIKIPIILTTRVNSSSNYSIKNISCQIDKKRSCNQSVGNLVSEQITVNEQEIEEDDEEEADDGYDNYEDEQIISDHHDKSATSQTSFLSSNLIVDNNTQNIQAKPRNDSEEMEEVEIIISLDNITKNTSIQMNKMTSEPLNDSLLVDERLKNIVMHMIPTTRKSYVDDIVNGVKELIKDQSELNKIGSPLDLPKNAVKFIQKRYSSLLTESNSISALGTDVLEINDSLKQTTSANDAINLDTTTEVTVVKEIRMPTQNESNDAQNDDIMKVEEETLYIVEKRRPIPITKQSNDTITPTTTPVVAALTDVDKEIRKNFELKSKEQTFDECSSNLKQFYATSSLIDELKKSIGDKMDDINDYQMHFYDSHHHVLVMLYDKDNNDNYRFNLEKKYHKSIIDTHVTNKKNDINIVAHLNVYYVNEETSKMSHQQFDLFSLIRPPTTSDDIASITNKKMFNSLPIGKYFVDIKYQQILSNNDLEHKQSLIDLSLLPLPIRIQLIYELETTCNTTDLPTIELLIQDTNLFKTKLNKSKENLIKDSFRKYTTTMDDSMKYIVLNNIHNLGLLKAELTDSDFNNNYELDNLIKSLESEFNTYYILNSLGDRNDLVKINRIDALVSFDLAQKFKELILPVIKHNLSINNDYDTLSKVTNETNCFYQLDNGKLYKCCLPFSDLLQKTNLILTSTSYDNNKNINENTQFSSISVIDPYTQSRATYILINDLASLFQIDELNIRSIAFKQVTNEFQISLDKLTEDDDNLPSLSESISDGQRVRIATQDEEKFKRDFLFNLSQQTCDFKMNSTAEGEDMIKIEQSFEAKLDEHLQKQQEKEFENQPNEPTQFETDRLKLDLHLNNVASYNAKQLRDKIIISEIDKMFTSIRDHQGSTAKAKGEQELVQLYQNKNKKKKGCTWSYSSNKRHVRAKIMELPVAEDINQLAKTIGINEFAVNETYEEDTVEKVFVRIDDFLNKDVSRTMQRSYSMDYLNHMASGSRTRIRYIRIPGQTLQTQSMMSCSYANPVYNIPTMTTATDCTTGSTEYRTAPYDLRYWSILKLLEEERNSNGQLLNYLDDQDWTTKQEPIPIEKLLSPSQKIETNIGEINYNDCVITSLDIDKDLEKFLSMNDLDKEIERVKKEKIYHREPCDELTKTTTSMSSSTTTTTNSNKTNGSTSNKKPQYIIKEKMMAKKPELIEPVMERIDAELSKLEQSGLIEKIDLQSIEFINKYNSNYNTNQSAFDFSTTNINDYEYHNQHYQTPSIIPQSYSVQNNGQGLEVPNQQGTNSRNHHSSITAKLQDLIISSPKIKYHMI